MNLRNALRRLAKPLRWLLRRVGLDIVRYRGEGGRRKELENKLASITDDTITAGPFKGARLPVSESWEDDRGSKLLGFYEQELRPFIEAVIEWKPDVVLNVGCAEGYYAIGMAKRIPGAKSFAYDVDPLAQAACKTARDLNHVDLVVRGLCTDAELRERTERAERPFMLIDCEGGERELLLSNENEYSYPNARIIVECHDFVDRSITSSLIDKFSQTHSIQTIKQAGRNPFCHLITAGWAENDLWLLVSERRPERMHWLYMTPKASK
jgi:SAM-dependent methyltransferase